MHVVVHELLRHVLTDWMPGNRVFSRLRLYSVVWSVQFSPGLGMDVATR